MAHVWTEEPSGEWMAHILHDVADAGESSRRTGAAEDTVQLEGLWADSSPSSQRTRVWDVTNVLESPARVLLVHCSPQNDGSAPSKANRVSQREGGWLLLAERDANVWVNGLPVVTGLRALHDRDEARVGAATPLYFSTERLARPEPLPSTDRALACPRCKQEIKPASSAVCCPDCGVWHHESGELPCWTYDATCALCPQPTDTDAGFRWTPEEL